MDRHRIRSTRGGSFHRSGRLSIRNGSTSPLTPAPLTRRSAHNALHKSGSRSVPTGTPCVPVMAQISMPQHHSLSPDPLIDLAPELVELILSFLKPSDIVSFGQTCKRASHFITPGNQLLWRSAFLKIFDNPKTAWDLLLPCARPKNRSREANWDWYRELRRRLEASNAVHEKLTNPAASFDPESVVKTFLDIVDTASFPRPDTSLNIIFLVNLFQNNAKAEKLVHDYHRDIESISLPLDQMQNEDRPITRSMIAGGRREIPEWASRFHILYGATSRESDSVRAKSSARAIVYDWSVTDSRAEYGPFIKDSTCSVNWATLEAISSLMYRVFEIGHGLHIPPSLFWHGTPYPVPAHFGPREDWAGVTLPWIGTYAFLDYRSLVHYNFANHLEHPMDLGGYEEACGDLMHLQLKIDNSEELRHDARLQTKLPYCTDLPMLFFKGTSIGRAQRPNILVRGSVSLTPDAKQVRWRFIISYAGEDQWALEGVQPGGVRSGAIYGLWSHVDHDDHGPMGPFSYFPSEDYYEEVRIYH